MASKTAMITIAGRPNVGKSTLTNRLVGEKVAIVSHKPQTTRNRICGIVNRGELQFVFVDTPGFHKPRTKLGDYMVSVTRQSVAQVDAVLLMVEPIANVGPQEEALLEQPAAEFTASESDSDVAYIQGKGKLVVGITEFAPMDYKDDNGEWIGFDADMAKLVAEKLGVEVEFVVIDWDMKVNELDSKNIDVVWNGMTLTEGVTAAMECTNAYCENAQVVITK